ncbi:sugar phosphate isomerase/epimerase family protein [Anaerocolumna jejuensis]|uniref:sugar phosphate isomerase/epimerase family protein n=1 Tax=Anaerocolumna jejuensis TaxID=259063 RepID=UPI003F7C61AD
MDYGMPTLIELETLRENAALCQSLGLQFIELNMNLPQYTGEVFQNLDYLKELSKEYGIYYTIHLDENLNVCDFNSRVAGAYEETVYETLKAAIRMGVPLLNMHMQEGVYFTLPDKKVYLFEKYKELYLRKLEQFRNRCTEIIGSNRLVISIENTNGYLPFQKEGIERMLESPAFTLTWDIGHSHAAGKADEEFILQHKERLKHFHIHDAFGKKNHLTLGTGEVNLAEKLSIAKDTRSRCVLETKTAQSLKESVKWLQENKILE